ncbi:hypothetical protein K525DRAFT_195592 [Schizophyllum commune Loenen D]|nr:hypothetical protein K525DRAFT_195592 [Schizophyllum commune Loenen D]
MESRYLAARKRSPSSDAGHSSSPKRHKTSTRDLEALLDCSQLLTQSAISSRFDEIAGVFLYDYDLVVCSDAAETCFRLLEFEFYLHKPGCHEDPFVHRTAEQGELGKWYFHRAPGKGTTKYRGGTRKGLDLTFGDADAYGGILLRSVQRPNSSEVISGPSLLVDKIVSLSGASDLVDLVESKWAGDTSAFTPRGLFLRPREDSACSGHRDICRTPRVGLDLSKASRAVYVAKAYRYIASFDSPLKSKAQTFAGAVYHCCYSPTRPEGGIPVLASEVSKSLHDPALTERLVKLTALSTTVAARYLKDYLAGFDNGSVESFVGKKNVASSPSAYLTMVGALHRSQLDPKPTPLPSSS